MLLLLKNIIYVHLICKRAPQNAALLVKLSVSSLSQSFSFLLTCNLSDFVNTEILSTIYYICENKTDQVLGNIFHNP